jgi:hypothetical protein
MNRLYNIKRSGAFRRRIEKHKNISSSIRLSLSNLIESQKATENEDSFGPSTSGSNQNVARVDTTNESLEIGDADSESETETELQDDAVYNYREKLRNWSVGHNIPHTAINALLKIINERDPNLVPNDARTLLNTVRNVDINPCSNGEYWHNGLKKNI